jgi:hypothetical protein
VNYRKLRSGFSTSNETPPQETAVGLQKSGYDLVDTAESITAIKDDDNFTGLTCLPDTVDPRRAEGKTNDAP